MEKSRTLFPLPSLGTYGCGYQEQAAMAEAARDRNKS